MTETALTPDRILDVAEDVLRRFGPTKATVVDAAFERVWSLVLCGLGVRGLENSAVEYTRKETSSWIERPSLRG